MTRYSNARKSVTHLGRWLILGAIPALLVAWLAGFILGARNDLLIWLYYIPALAAALLGSLWCWFARRIAPRWLWVVAAALTLLAAGKMLVGDFRWHRPVAPGPEAMRVVHWNVAYAWRGRDGVFKRVATHRPDLVCLSELRHTPSLSNEVRNALGFEHTFQDQGMAVLSRYPFTPQGTIPLPSARAWWARIDTPQGPLDVAVVDLISHPHLNREQPLDALAAWVARHDDAIPLLIMGDFNTPRDARAFRPLRVHLQHAYETSGRGWPYSWPLPLPLYSLDHTWYSPGLRITGYRLQAARISDHLRQVMDVELVKPVNFPLAEPQRRGEEEDF